MRLVSCFVRDEQGHGEDTFSVPRLRSLGPVGSGAIAEVPVPGRGIAGGTIEQFNYLAGIYRVGGEREVGLQLLFGDCFLEHLLLEFDDQRCVRQFTFERQVQIVRVELITFAVRNGQRIAALAHGEPCTTKTELSPLPEYDLVGFGLACRGIDAFAFTLLGSTDGEGTDLRDNADFLASQYCCERSQRFVRPDCPIEYFELERSPSDTETNIVNCGPFVQVDNDDAALLIVGKVCDVVHGDRVTPVLWGTAILDWDLQTVAGVRQRHAEDARGRVVNEDSPHSPNIGDLIATNSDPA